ncbi:hypothetical protein ACJX0J_027137, partial [Zea mays]
YFLNYDSFDQFCVSLTILGPWQILVCLILLILFAYCFRNGKKKGQNLPTVSIDLDSVPIFVYSVIHLFCAPIYSKLALLALLNLHYQLLPFFASLNNCILRERERERERERDSQLSISF